MKSAGNPVKRDYIDLALAIQKFHIEKLRSDIHWTEQQTATALKRSLGSVSQYLSIASWCRTHENQIRRLETMNEAITWIRQHKRQLILGEPING